jgi:hypothetical protein
MDKQHGVEPCSRRACAFRMRHAAGLDTNAYDWTLSADAAWSQLQVWRDLNQDGVSQANELSSLGSQNITGIGLTPSTTVTNLGNGNTITGTATVTRSNGTTTTAAGVGVNTTAANLDLANNPFYREFTTPVALTAVAQGLPQMQGSGWVRAHFQPAFL